MTMLHSKQPFVTDIVSSWKIWKKKVRSELSDLMLILRSLGSSCIKASKFWKCLQRRYFYETF